MTVDFARPVRIGVQIRPQHAEYGFPFGTPAERSRQLEEGLARIEQRLAALNPPPVRKIPVLLGGGGERRTLALVARFADIWNTFAEGEDYERKSRVLDEYCAQFGRDPAAIERSVLVGGPPDKSGEPLLAMGARLFVLGVNPSDDLAEVERWVAWRDRRNE